MQTQHSHEATGDLAVLYAAKSTPDEKGSIPDQLRVARERAECEGRKVVAEYEDENASAWSGNRGPGLEEALAHAERLGCELWVLHSDRLCRGDGVQARHLVQLVLEAKALGIRLRSVEDDSSLDNVLMAAAMGERNSEDSRRKSASTSAGLRRRAKERGLFTGPPPCGYEHAADGSGLVVVPAEAEVVRRIFSEYVAGRSMTSIAQELQRDGVPTKTGKARWRQAQISGIVRNPVFIGKVKHKGDLFDGVHMPIVSAELWARAQQLIAATPSKRGRPPKEKRHLFTGGFLRCGHCGDPMCPRTRRNYEFYECMGRLHGCVTGAVRRVDIDGAVLSYFERVALDVDATRQQLVAAASQKVAEARALHAVAERESQQAAERLARVRTDYVNGDLTAAEWRDLRADLEPEAQAAEAEAKRLRDRLTAAEAGPDTVVGEAEAIAQLAHIRAAIAGDVNDAAGVEAVRAALRRMFDSFIFHREGTTPSAAGGARGPEATDVDLDDDQQGGRWIEPIVSWHVIEGFDEDMRPVVHREPLEQAVNKQQQASGWL